MVFLVICFAASVIGAISGIGGGVIIKPLLDAATTLDSSTISFLSACAVFSMSLATTVRYAFKRMKIGKSTIFLGIGSAVGGVLGTYVFRFMVCQINRDELIKLIQNVILLILLFLILLYMNQRNRKQFHTHGTWIILIVGIALGCLSSFLGIGGGPINVAILTLLFAMPIKEASIHSVILILFSQSTKLLTTLVTAAIPSAVEPSMLFYIIPAAIIGGLLGSLINKKMNRIHITQAYNAVMVFIITTCLWNIIKIL